jgi:hypothetical protein
VATAALDYLLIYQEQLYIMQVAELDIAPEKAMLG